jgi:hypothetical protein
MQKMKEVCKESEALVIEFGGGACATSNYQRDGREKVNAMLLQALFRGSSYPCSRLWLDNDAVQRTIGEASISPVLRATVHVN